MACFNLFFLDETGTKGSVVGEPKIGSESMTKMFCNDPTEDCTRNDKLCFLLL